ncbi:MAG: hypothetical protein R6V85_09900 [Polyangia bacterium]
MPKALVSLAIAASLHSSTTSAEEPSRPPDYMPAIRQELARLDANATCDDASATCVFTRSAKDGRSFEIALRYSEKTRTVYIFIERYLVLDGSSGPSLELARRLLELNRRLVTAKFEWDRTGGTVRLSMVLNTDSNFDRRALRSQIEGLGTAATELWPELSTLADGSDEGGKPEKKETNR